MYFLRLNNPGMFEVQLIIQSKQKMRSERTMVVSKVLNMLRDYWTWTWTLRYKAIQDSCRGITRSALSFKMIILMNSYNMTLYADMM